MSEDQQKCKLYLISPPTFEFEKFKEDLKEAFSGGEVAVFQLRMKSLAEDGTYTVPEDKEKIKRAALELIPICHENKCVFILNDDPELAMEVGADGVHLGDEDMSVAEARKILGEDKYIGASCYGSKDRAYTAAEQGADYVAFGAFYDTETKQPKGRPTPEFLEFWSTYTTLPSVAIGGIKVHNAKPIIDAGADFIAVVTGVWNYEKGVKQAVIDFNQLF